MSRYCILTLPRSGSQLCEHILEDKNSNSYKLGEIFEEGSHFDYILENNRINKLLNITKKIYADDRVCDDYENKLNLINNSYPTVDYTLRIFLKNHRNLYIEKKIIAELTKNNFIFISLLRNYEDVVLSNLIAKYYILEKKQNIYGIGTQIPILPITIPIESNFVYYYISTLFTSYLFWNERIKKLLGNTHVYRVQYETIYSDCAKILGHEIDPIPGKTLVTNGYDYIINSDEIREIIKPYKELLDKQNGQNNC